MSAQPIPLHPEPGMLEAALEYAAAGFRVLPVCPDKVPHIKEWQKKATTDEATIRDWFHRWPRARLGIAGDTESGVVFVDLDTKSGDDGIANWQAYLQFKGIDVPPTVVVETPNQGRHLWFRDAVGYKTLTGSPAAGVDVRAEGGFVLVPPSQGYTFLREWTPDTVLPDLPDGVRERAGQKGPTTAVAEPEPSTPEYARSAFALSLAELAVAEEGTRNDTLNTAAYQAAGHVADGSLPIPEETARGMLRAAALHGGLDRRETEATLDSAFRAVAEGRPPAPRRTTRPILWGDADEDEVLWGPAGSPLWVGG
jgi:hypothetical protein